MKCGIESGFSGIPWIDQFNLVNANDTHETEKAATGIGLSCNFEELERFELFFSKFVNAAREFFLPPERHSFGLVSNRSLLQYLGVEDSESWLAMLKFAGCPSCSKILKEGNDLKSVLQMDNGIVSELDGDGQDLDTVLPAKKPSILLFVDRSSSSSETRRKSKETLDNFRVLAQQYLIPHQIGQETKDHPGRPSVQANQVLSTSGHPRLKLSPRAQKLKFHDKMSIMVLDEGKHVSLDSIATDSQGNSLQEILEYLLQKRKGAKLSSVAKEVGFRLLSDDIDIKIADEPLTSQTEFQPNQVSTTPSEEGLITVNVDLDKDQSPHGASIPAVERKENSKSSDMSSHHDDEQKVSVDTKEQYQKVSVDTKEQLIPEASDQYYLGHDLTTAKDVKVGEKSSSQISMSGDPQLEFQGFRGSFFFNDGNYRLLGALTGGSTIPSLAIVDPISNQHYVASKEATFNYSSMADFLHGFLNGTLLPYQRSESILQISREATHPPFVNMDFHEVDSIPRVTVHSFSDLVGLNQSDNENAFSAWNEDVVVLFSSSWCGFCQRMELVVREVFRAVKGYMKSLKNGYKNGQRDLNGEYLKNINFKLPRIYLMDCTLNDCSLILKSMTQREVYPALVLFPAERKNAISFKGDISVADVIKFIADHGNNSHDLLNENGIIWTLPEKEGRYQNLFEDPSPTIGNKEASVTEEGLHEVILKSETSKAAERDSWIKSHTSKSLHETAHSVVAGSILIATDKLLGVHPFENSKILIVKADQSVGFQGLIFNKHIGWDSLQELEKGLDFLKEAPLSFGGPLIKHRMPLVSLTRRVTKSQYPEIVPGVYFLDQSATVNEIEELKSGNHSIADYWFFLGFSGWGWDQLFHEIAQGAWTTGEDRMGHLDWPSD
ncbi:hypothetical protein CICLE_v10030666mg [Citrus x clementina]|uniref:Thioredoxin domain-containing protein n=2 Tax=Citrus clementina TaxID=85681 RepID=V4TGP1_CITCL|nr:uncharacterized protein LOC18044800 isoform X4 [Citrus x clementina]ESR50760.1 hypothetical protein CICLE_v10030666mg [Citrus x clementina]